MRDLGAWAGQGFALHGALQADRMTEVLAGPPVPLGAVSAPAADISNAETARSVD